MLKNLSVFEYGTINLTPAESLEGCSFDPLPYYMVGQGSTIIIELPYVYQNFDVGDVHGEISKSIYQASYLLPNDFPNNFSQACFYLNRKKDC